MEIIYTTQIGGARKRTSLKKNGKKQRNLYDLLHKTIQSFPKKCNVPLFGEQVVTVTQPYFSGKREAILCDIKSEKKLVVEYKNLRKLHAKLYRLDSPLSAVYSSNRGRQQTDEKKTLIREIWIPLSSRQPYERDQTELELNITEFGSYKLEFESDPVAEKEGNNSFYFSVSGLAVFSRLSAKDTYEFFVVDRA